MYQVFLKKYIRFIPAFLWALFILYLCMLPGKDLPKTQWLDFLSLDKIVHLIFFFTLCTLLLNAVLHLHQIFLLTWYSKILQFLLCGFYGLGIEILQQAFTDRHFDLWDAFANFLGAFLAIIFFEKIRQNKWFRYWDQSIP